MTRLTSAGAALATLMALACGFAAPSPAQAPAPVAATVADYPTRPIRLIVPFPPGGAADLIARTYSTRVGELLGQPLVIDNRPGADTIIGMEQLARAPADGYTLILAINSALTMNPALYSKLPYDPARDFAPISAAASAPLALVTPASSTADSAAALGAMLRSRSADYSYGAGNTVARIGAEALLAQVGGRAVPVMYKGSAPTIIDVMRGEVQFAFEPVVVVVPHVKAGKMKALAVASSHRSLAAPDVPTMAESGLAGFEIPVWFGFMAPAGTPPAVVDRLQDAVAHAGQAATVRGKLGEIGVEVNTGTADEFRKTVEKERAVWLPRIQQFGIRID